MTMTTLTVDPNIIVKITSVVMMIVITAVSRIFYRLLMLT